MRTRGIARQTSASRARIALLLVACAVMACKHSTALAQDSRMGALERLWRSIAGPSDWGSYPLDETSRAFEGTCPDVELVRYAGTSVRFDRSVKVHPALVPKLAELESLIEQVALRVYGRKPTRIVHAGAYNCRSVRLNGSRLSEHGLGNALDVRGFDFAPARGRQALPEGVPRALRRGFEVRIARHWPDAPDTSQPGAPGAASVEAVHARFLSELRSELESRPQLFRCIYGPSHPGHRDHLHFDMAPYRYVHL